VPEPTEPVTEVPIDAHCAVCGFKLNWKVVLGEKRSKVATFLTALLFAFGLLTLPSEVSSHRSGCHRWHSCPSDRGSYVCGDIGYCSQCPDNQYCLNRNPRRVPERERSSKAQPTKKAEWRLVTRVVDGDTIIVGAGERVRLIGVDTPETKHPNKPVEYYGREATRFTRKMVQGKRVRLEFDQANYYLGHKDKYRRTLAYVFLQDGTFLNAEIIKRGYGFAYTRFPFKYMDRFRRYEREAREQGRGLWAKDL